MNDKSKTTYAAPGEELAEHEANELIRRQIGLLKAIIRIFRESVNCETEEDMALICLEVAEELTCSAYGFIGELNQEGLFDTTTLSKAGWAACKVPGEDALALLRNMPNRGINRIGLMEQ